MARKPKRPKPFTVGAVKVRVVRGPHKEDAARWYWRAERYASGGSFTVWTGWASEVDARREVAAVVADGADDAPREAQRGSSPEPEIRTVRDLLRWYGGWVREHPQRATSTKRNVTCHAKNLSRLIGETVLDRLNTATLEDYQNARLRETDASGTVINEVGTLAAAWRWGRDRGHCPDRLLRKPPLRYKKVAEQYVPTPSEYSATRGQVVKSWQALYMDIASATGMRLSEVAYLEWRDVDLQNATIYVRKGERRKTDARDVVIPESLVAILDAVPEEERTGRVLAEVTPNTARRQIIRDLPKWCEAAEVTVFPSQSIRKMVINQYYDAGVDVGTVAAQLGHSPEVALKYYRCATPQARRRAVALAGLGAASNVRNLDTARAARES